MNDFTTAEYITRHALPARSRADQRAVVQHLRELGYTPHVAKRDGKSVRVWRRINDDLASRLAELKNR